MLLLLLSLESIQKRRSAPLTSSSWSERLPIAAFVPRASRCPGFREPSSSACTQQFCPHLMLGDGPVLASHAAELDQVFRASVADGVLGDVQSELCPNLVLM